MKKIMSAKWAANLLLGSLGLLALFDILVLLKVIPANIVWGGAIQDSTASLVALELIALIVTLLFAAVVAVKANFINAGKFKKAASIGVRLIFAYLLLNTVGNLASGVAFENLIFAPVTVLLAFCAFRLAIEK
jgi:hypothetical protein